MDSETHLILDEIHLKHENEANKINTDIGEADETRSESLRVRIRALLVALLGISMSVCAIASQPVELELEDQDVENRLNNVSMARRITKPTIKIIMGHGKLSALVTAATSMLLLIAIMSKQRWCHRGVKWLAVPALLVTALEVVSDAGESTLAAFLQGSTSPLQLATLLASSALLISIEILVWYFIAKFFEQSAPLSDSQEDKDASEVLPILSDELENMLLQ